MTVRALAARIGDQVGRRGAALLAFAFIDYVIGWSLLDRDGQAQANALPAYRAFREVAPLTVWAWLWLAVAVTCTVNAFRRQDRAGFVAAVGIKVLWAAGFFASWLVWHATRGWLAASTWLVIGALVYLIASWPEGRRPR